MENDEAILCQMSTLSFSVQSSVPILGITGYEVQNIRVRVYFEPL